jgi:hypothetical protein
MRSASTSELPKKLLSPDRELVLPDLKDADSLSVQIETERLNGVKTTDYVKNVIPIVLKLSEEVQERRKDNEMLKSSISKIAVSVSVSSVQTVKSAL